jgi:hypothetical protein
MSFKNLHWGKIGVLLLLLVWIGMWGAWIPARTVGLTQNAFYLAEWSTLLPELRFGGLAYLAEVLRLSVALAVVALAVSVGVVKSPLARWAIRMIACLPGLVILPPYPEVLNLWWSASYGNRFIVATVLFGGVLLSALTDLLPTRLQRWLVSGLSLAAAGLGIWAFFSLRVPFEACYTGVILPGWGFGVFVGGLMVTGVTQIVDLLQGSSPSTVHGSQSQVEGHKAQA